MKALSIQISLNGLSFCILNKTTNTIELLQELSFSKKTSPFEILERLKTELDSNQTFAQSFKSVLLIYKNELSTLVPKPFFNEENLADYLKFNTKILKTDYITYDTLSFNDCINVYVPLVNINNYIFETYGAFEYKHTSTILIDQLIQQSLDLKDSKVYISVHASGFEIVVIKGAEIQFYNTFEYHTKEDFIYYILFTMEQLKLDPETVNIVLLGQINKEDELYQIIYKYIRFVTFIEPLYDHSYIEGMQPTSVHQNFILLNSFK